MNDTLTLIVYILLGVLVLGGVLFVLLRGPKAPPGGYETTRDADDAPAQGEPVTTIEKPASAQGRLVRLRARLSRSNNLLGKGLLALLSSDKIDQDVWDEVEETLLLADLGSGPSQRLVEALQSRVRVEGTENPAAVKAMLREELLRIVGEETDRSLNLDGEGNNPGVVLVVGVNGVGKTTTVGKLARVMVAEDKNLLLGCLLYTSPSPRD